MKQYKLALLIAVSFASAGLMANPATVTEGTYYGGTSDDEYVNVGVSDVNAGSVHVAGRAGFAVNSTGINTQIDFQGLSAYSTASSANVDWGSHTVYQLSYPYSGPADEHDNLGVFAFAKVGSNDLWIGEWSSTGDVTNGTHTVYYFGKDYDSTIPSSGEITYNVVGINDYDSTSGGNLLSGQFTANFYGVAGILEGSIENTSGFKIDIGSAQISSAAIISGTGGVASDASGTLATGGAVSGRFFNSHDDLAGLVRFGTSNSQYDTAFGGSVAP